jgi:hypothetical protein
MQLATNPKRATSVKARGLTRGKPAIMLTGMMIGKPAEMSFIPNRDYTYCRVCGTIYQPALSQVPDHEYTAEVQYAATLLRREWSHNHAYTHSSTEHRQLHLSGRHLTPEAQTRLAAFGLIALTDLALDAESAAAGLEAPRMPDNDVEV